MKPELKWQAEDIIRAVHGNCLSEHSWAATGVSIDSRTIQKGDLFIALQGPTHDGHEHVASAFANGAAAAIVSKQPAQLPAKAPLITVEDTFRALEDLGQAGRARAEARIIAVTGSVGKTSSKEMLRLMLSAVGSTYANEGSLNNHWGVPLSLARLPQDARYGVFELGMNHAGELTVLSKQARPHVALITTIEPVHLEFFDSVDAIADAKAEIFLGMEPGGTAVLNRDNGSYARLLEAAKKAGLKKIVSFGSQGKGEAKLLSYDPTPQGTYIKAEILGNQVAFELQVPGEHLALNALGCLLAAASVGADIEVCATALNHYIQPRGRGVQEKIDIQSGSFTLIDESYNASPAAVRAALKVLAHIPAKRRLFVLGDMRELGATSPTLHADLAKDIAAADIDLVFTCGEMAKYLHDALPANRQGIHATDSTALAPLVATSLQSGDTITVKGSNGMRMNKVVEALRALGQNQSAKVAS